MVENLAKQNLENLAKFFKKVELAKKKHTDKNFAVSKKCSAQRHNKTENRVI